MLFNSIEFAIFFPLVFFIYWAINKHLRLQNIFILLVSYIFYAWWDWRFLSLLVFTTSTTYLSGILISKSDHKRAKWWMLANIVINLSILGTFKYFNFFADGLRKIFEMVGFYPDWATMNVILPIGISFYTFQAISYSVDVYRGIIKPTRSPLLFFSYISFFPQLLAGPIEKAGKLIPQFSRARSFDYDNAVIGMRQILWGLVKKILIADMCAYYVNEIYLHPQYYGGASMLWIIVLFLFQMYGDFSGYSDIAIGTARLMGIELSQNFRFPLFSRSFSEFWRRWNMTLMGWFRDYVYIPLGGSRRGQRLLVINVLIVFFLSGLWHGASAVMIGWGVANGLCFIPALLWGKKYSIDEPYKLSDIPKILLTFSVIAILTFIAMNCGSIESAIKYFQNVSNAPFFGYFGGKTPLIFLVPFIVIEWLGRKNQFAIEKIPFPYRWQRMLVYWVISLLLIYGTNFETQEYIYFQF